MPSQQHLDQYEYHGLARLTYKINHHKYIRIYMYWIAYKIVGRFKSQMQKYKPGWTPEAASYPPDFPATGTQAIQD